MYWPRNLMHLMQSSFNSRNKDSPGMDLTMWGPWAQDLVGALLKLRQGDSSTRFVGRYVRNKKIENI